KCGAPPGPRGVGPTGNDEPHRRLLRATWREPERLLEAERRAREEGHGTRRGAGRDANPVLPGLDGRRHRSLSLAGTSGPLPACLDGLAGDGRRRAARNGDLAGPVPAPAIEPLPAAVLTDGRAGSGERVPERD